MIEQRGFAVWLTGLPASGKSSIARDLAKRFRDRGVPAVVLESDILREILTPAPTYDDAERSRFYRSLVLIGELIIRSGINVIFDATANKREFRDFARQQIGKFVEAYVSCPLEVCIKRDPKGIYAKAAHEMAANVPGVQAAYEPPLTPDVILNGEATPEKESALVLDKLKQLLYI